MTYAQSDAYADIQSLEDLWANGSTTFSDGITAMQRLIYNNATYDPSIKLVVAAQNLFANALSKEATGVDPSSWSTYQSICKSTQTFTGDSCHPSRWYLLDGIRRAIEPGLFSLGDPAGIADWIGLADPAGAALAQTITSDPDPEVRLAALQLVKSTALPTSWVRGLTGALNAMDTYVESSGLDQGTRTTLAAASKDARVNVLLTANRLAQGTNFGTIMTGGGDSIQMDVPPPRTSVLPWYKRIELWGALLGGIAGGVELFKRRSSR